MFQSREALDQQTGANQQNERESNFAHDQSVTGPAARAIGAS